MNEITKLVIDERAQTIKVTASDPQRTGEYKKIVVRPVEIKGKKMWQAERFKGAQVFHLNLKSEELSAYFDREIIPLFAQISVCLTDCTTTYFLKNGKIVRRKSTADVKREKTGETHNREKEFVLGEGEPVPALVDLGIFTPDFKVVKGMYDKYRQINRFIETVDDCFKNYVPKEMTVLDFGCGKSYLTFILYYYFTKIRKINAKIIGYDLKADVVEKCNEIAKSYGYNNLTFVRSDVTKDVLYDEKIDMIVSLHACDVATDYALDYAIKHKVKYIFSVPCCQHEINLSIKNSESPTGADGSDGIDRSCGNTANGSNDFAPLLKYGLIKERFSAMLTDSIRACVLEDFGYDVDVVEFVGFESTPKNLMIRAILKKRPDRANRESLLKLKEKYGFEQTLLRLTAPKE